MPGEARTVPMDAEPCGVPAGSRASHHIQSCFQDGGEVGTVVGETGKAPRAK